LASVERLPRFTGTGADAMLKARDIAEDEEAN
jgi:hypothetical protein